MLINFSRTDGAPAFHHIVDSLRRQLLASEVVDVGEWQAQRGGVPARTAEIEDISFCLVLPENAGRLAALVRPNVAWADEHFAERVSGVPYNPPPSHVRWPFAVKSNAAHVGTDERFSHTYPERLWPKYGPHGVLGPREGIRYRYGDLDDVVMMLKERRSTRQAFIPIWFPEDTGAPIGRRVPCTLGYHVMVRRDVLKIVYYIRSCDFLRHFRDDVYLAGRLAYWLAEQINAKPGRLIMHISSLHVFEADLPRLRHVAEHDA